MSTCHHFLFRAFYVKSHHPMILAGTWSWSQPTGAAKPIPWTNFSDFDAQKLEKNLTANGSGAAFGERQSAYFGICFTLRFVMFDRRVLNHICMSTYIYIYVYILCVYIYITYKKCTYGDMIGDLIHNVAGTKQPDFPSPRGWKQFRKNALVCSLDGHPLVHCCGASKQSRGSQCLTSSFQNNLDLESGECGSSTSKPPVVQT